jgi:hypothetical protein
VQRYESVIGVRLGGQPQRKRVARLGLAGVQAWLGCGAWGAAPGQMLRSLAAECLRIAWVPATTCERTSIRCSATEPPYCRRGLEDASAAENQLFLAEINTYWRVFSSEMAEEQPGKSGYRPTAIP